MNQQEFEQRTGARNLTADEWATIHTVYQWHPAISDRTGKEEIASLWALGGLGLLEDMLPIARQVAQLEDWRNTLKNEIADYTGQLGEIRARYGRKGG